MEKPPSTMWQQYKLIEKERRPSHAGAIVGVPAELNIPAIVHHHGSRCASLAVASPSPSSAAAAVGEERELRAFSSFVSSLPPEAYPPPPSPPPTVAVAPEEETKAEEPFAPALAERESEEPPKAIEAEEEPLKPAESKEPLKTTMVEEKASPLPPMEEKAVMVDKDGAKTVEVIEETMVPIAPPAIEEVTPTVSVVEPEKEASGETPTVIVAPEKVFASKDSRSRKGAPKASRIEETPKDGDGREEGFSAATNRGEGHRGG
uniref:Skin secretory protein xP2-like n=1 Tax=Elaeis guineensis var. tenera TaxID=51953 RepID=A0A6I9QZ24_ELAGV|nr:skin secretory protein xP2-like [Elaeis guineensis]